MSYEKFIAKRYLLSKHKINFITIISFISITGITLGVAALSLCFPSLMDLEVWLHPFL